MRLVSFRRARRATPSGEPRWLIDRRVAAALFVVLTLSLPLHFVQRLGDALGEPTLRTWLLAADAGLKTLVWAAFAVFIYRRSPSRTPARSARAFVACAAAIVPGIFLAAPDPDGAIWAFVAGEALVVVAVAFTLASVLSLGTCFGVLPEVRGLVTRGPYGFVRHPVYVGEIVAFTGFVVASQRPLNALPLVVFCLGQAARLRLEEAALLAEFPDEYGSYARRTPRLVPRPAAVVAALRDRTPAIQTSPSGHLAAADASPSGG